MIVEYAAIAGAPAPDTPWPLVVAVAERGRMFTARTQLATLDAVWTAISAAMPGGDPAAAGRARSDLIRSAYPSDQPQDPDAVFAPNMFAEDDDDGE